MKTLILAGRRYALLGVLALLILYAPTPGTAQTVTSADLARATGKSSSSATIGPRRITASSSDGALIKPDPHGGATINLGETEIRLRGNSLYHEGEVVLVLPPAARQVTIDWQDERLRIITDGRTLLNRHILESAD